MATRTVKLIDYKPFCENAPGVTYTIDIDGVTHTVEQWSTTSSGGTDFYRDGDLVVVDDEVTEAVDEIMEEFEAALAGQYAERSLDAQITAATSDAVAAVPERTVEVENDDDDDLPEWTVFGLLDGDNLMVAAVIPGSHNVADSDDNSDGYQRYATSVRAHDAADAETAAIDEAAQA